MDEEGAAEDAGGESDDAGSGAAEMDPGPDTERELDPVDAFSLLGDPVRLQTVTALHDADGAVPFSALYDRVDVEDSGRFNYHRDQLVPHFVAKTDDGYELTSAGRRVARAVASGTYTDVPRLDPFDIDGTCYACGSESLSASYDDERFRVRCRDCDELVLGVRVPPSVVRGREPREVVDAVDRWSRHQVDAAAQGLCPTCGGPVETGVTEDVHETIQFDVLATFDCGVCGRRAMTSFGAMAYRDRTAREFLRERGRDPADRRYWEVDQCVTGEHVAVESRDPWRVRTTFYADGDACHVVMDGDLAVVDVSVDAGGASAARE